jgi:hypothetical protein
MKDSPFVLLDVVCQAEFLFNRTRAFEPLAEREQKWHDLHDNSSSPVAYIQKRAKTVHEFSTPHNLRNRLRRSRFRFRSPGILE